MIEKAVCTLEDFKDIIQVFQEDAGDDNVSARIDPSIFSRLFISAGYEEQNELMLRLNIHQKKLVVARIAFINQRKGYGSKLFDLLDEYGRNNGYDKIVVESALTPEIQSFLEKRGFKLASDYIHESNWEILIQK